ncbi:protein kinase [Sorangium cellulosum]|uniref:Protein kinase n=1 Tax=Sorangium cellulosum TaxID=56 RepID=A0A4P2Q5J3_SORCE|nr:serine/threonine-protein kinase [Sorangium cellulosum]AUX24233.1 protein kinase [Sorangium cellulosum]
MRAGELVDDRFALEAQIGAGGMGTVWRALDRATGEAVALKLLRDPVGGDAARFAQEARILAAIEHPHVVRYVGHGLAPTREPYLAMEWLRGEDLAARLSRGGLTLEDGLNLVQRAAGALGAVHARGIVHRDVKPSNLFLVGGDVARVKLLDFGIARQPGVLASLTQTGAILGTPGYLAPEQAQGEREVGPQADVFALGAVLFECVTGSAAFRGMQVMALLAKLLLEEPPRLIEVRADVPRELSELCHRMLAKDPRARPAHGAAVAEALARLPRGAASRAAPRQDAARAPIGTTERRLVSILAIAPPQEEPAGQDDATVPVAAASWKIVRDAVQPLGATVDVLADGTTLVVLEGAGNATDQAARAARCALRVRADLPRAEMALVTGRGDTTERQQVGEIVERAATLLGQMRAHGSARAPGMVLDEVTRALLDTRFEVTESGELWVLVRERMLGEQPRLLLGRPSPFVGRDRELQHLLGLLEDAFEDRRAVAVTVTAPAGMGKSRLRLELMARLSDRVPNLAVVIGRGDSLGAKGGLGLLGSGLRGTLGIEAGERPSAQQEKIRSAVERTVAGDAAERVAEFLGELVGAPFPDEKSPRLRAARRNAQLMAEQVESACLDFVRAVTRRGPLLWVLEDLHWGDPASVKLCDVALRELRDEPFGVLAFARPELHEIFPRLWAERNAQEVRLGPLSKRAAEAMVSAALRDPAAARQIAALVERAEGNAFFIEELIRAAVDGRSDTLPETVLGMVEARLSALPPEARRLLRAASVFGDRFWKSGVLALLDEEAARSEELLADLIQREIVARRVERRFAGEEEYAFRHALVRQAAYAMLLDRDRQVGHGLAGAWLERAGEPDPVVLAEHFERGAVRGKAALWHARAAERALRSLDLAPALSSARRGLAMEPEGERSPELWVHVTEAAGYTGDHAEAMRAAEEVMARASVGSPTYCRALGLALLLALMLRRPEALSALMDRLLKTQPAADAIMSLAHALSTAVFVLLIGGQRDAAALFLGRLRAIAAPAVEEDPSVTAYVDEASAFWECYVERNPWAAMRLHAAAGQRLAIAEDLLSMPHSIAFMGWDYAMLGAFEEAERCVERSLSVARSARANEPLSRLVLANVRLGELRLDETVAAAEAALEEARSQGEGVAIMAAQVALAEARLLRGEVDAAAEVLDGSDAGTSGLVTVDAMARGLRAKLLLARGRAEEAAREAEQVIALVRGAGVFDARHASLLLTRAEALDAAGEAEAARAALREAREDLLTRAARIEDPAYRRSFLERVPEHARTLLVAREWLGEGTCPGMAGP